MSFELPRCRATMPRTGSTDVEASSSSRLEIVGSSDTRPLQANPIFAASRCPSQPVNLPQPPVQLVPTRENAAHAIVDRIHQRGRLLTLDSPTMRTKHLAPADQGITSTGQNFRSPQKRAREDSAGSWPLVRFPRSR